MQITPGTIWSATGVEKGNFSNVFLLQNKFLKRQFLLV